MVSKLCKYKKYKLKKNKKNLKRYFFLGLCYKIINILQINICNIMENILQIKKMKYFLIVYLKIYKYNFKISQ